MLDFLLQPEIDVGLSVNEPLLDVSQLNAGNLLTVTMETLYAPPESWTHTGTQYAFAAALPVPFNGEVFYYPNMLKYKKNENIQQFCHL